MRANSWLAVTVVVLGFASLARTEVVPAPGGSARYASEIEASVAGRSVQMTLTGVAMRTKLVFNVYAIGSYVQKGTAVRSAEDLVGVDCPKRLHLVMERTIDGKDLADAFRSAIRLNHADPSFTDEINTLCQLMRSTSARKGEHIYLTHVPGIGLHCNIAGKAEYLIKNVAFAHAVWEIYLGKNNIGETIKKGLTSRL